MQMQGTHGVCALRALVLYVATTDNVLIRAVPLFQIPCPYFLISMFERFHYIPIIYTAYVTARVKPQVRATWGMCSSYVAVKSITGVNPGFPLGGGF